jgi:glycosyltransferase involved in cell wall biosynthesis
VPHRTAVNEPVPIALFVRKLDWGGIERDVTKLAVGLDGGRFAPHVVVFESGGLRYEEVRQAGLPILDLEISSLTSPRTIRSAVRLGNWLLGHHIRLIHAFDGTIVFTAPLARLLRVPVILSSTLGHRDLFEPKTRKQLAFTDRLVDAIVVNCQAMRRHMIEDYGVTPERTILSYNGVETAEFFPLEGPKPAPVADASLVIGSVCVLRPEKRMELLIAAFAAVRPIRPGMKLLIVGSGPELSKLQAEAARLGVENDCLFLPAVKRVAPYLRAVDIFVSCSSSEAFSNAILEAMACGCCPVGSRVGGTPELIEDGERGLLFRSGDLQDLSDKLASLISNNELRRQFASNAAAFAATTLNMQAALDRMSRIYREELDKKGKWN